MLACKRICSVLSGRDCREPLTARILLTTVRPRVEIGISFGRWSQPPTLLFISLLPLLFSLTIFFLVCLIIAFWRSFCGVPENSRQCNAFPRDPRAAFRRCHVLFRPSSEASSAQPDVRGSGELFFSSIFTVVILINALLYSALSCCVEDIHYDQSGCRYPRTNELICPQIFTHFVTKTRAPTKPPWLQSITLLRISDSVPPSPPAKQPFGCAKGVER